MRFRIVFFLVVCSSSSLRTNAQLTPSQTDALTKLQGSKSSVACSAAETSSCAEAASKLMPLIMGDSPMLENLRRLTDQIGGRVTASPERAKTGNAPLHGLRHFW